MPWVRLSDDWYDDEDLIEAGPAAMLVWPLLITWSLRNLKDGKVPSRQVRRLVDWHELGIDPAQVIASLVEVGRLQEIAGGYLIVNFLKYQPSKEKVLADREASKVRAAKSRDRQREGAEGVRDACADGADAPVPGPVPDLESSSSSSSSDLVPESVWLLAAKKKSQMPNAKVGNYSRWSKQVIANDKAEKGDDAAWIWATYRITEDQLAGIIASGSRSVLNTLSKREDPAA